MTTARNFQADVPVQSSRPRRERPRLIRLTAAFSSLLVLLLTAGCATTGRPGEIPLGQWTGQGTFTYEHWSSGEGEDDQDDKVSLTRDYSTTLTIKNSTLDDRDILEVEILSKRGDLPGLHIADESHLVLALVKAGRISDSTVLYRMIASQFNPGADDKLEIDDDAPPSSASCTTKGAVTVLQIQYDENFVDTFRFHGPRVEKTGFWFSPGQAFVHWFERLETR